jgi:hypothetical protein
MRHALAAAKRCATSASCTPTPRPTGLRAARFDLRISRFGVFFADPVAAFTNLATRSGRVGSSSSSGRTPGATSGPPRCTPGSVPARRPPTARPATASTRSRSGTGDDRGNPTAAGLADVRLADVHEPVYYGPDVETASDLILELRDTQALLARLDEEEVPPALDRLRDTLAAHASADGVLFDSRVWIVTARRWRAAAAGERDTARCSQDRPLLWNTTGPPRGCLRPPEPRPAALPSWRPPRPRPSVVKPPSNVVQ